MNRHSYYLRPRPRTAAPSISKRSKKPKARINVDCWYCHDCRTDVRLEYYMVHDTVWQEAQGRNGFFFLCIGCLENRLGRRLQSLDFTGCYINRDPNLPRTHRLTSRMQT